MPTVDRVLPWRRNERPPADEVAPLLAAFRARHPKASTDRIARAYLTSAEAHRGQYRRSGEPYIQHPLAVARIVADLGLDDVTVAAALLHDAVEDTGHHPRGPRGGVRQRRHRDRRRRHQARPHQVRHQGGAAGRLDAQDARGDGQGPPGPHHQAVRPAPQHAHDRGDAGVQAGANRPRDPRHLRAARPSARHAGGAPGARGPLLRGHAPEALRRDRPHGVDPQPRARPLPHPGARAGARAPRRAADQRRGHRSSEAPLLHLREDGREGPRVRRHLRPRRASGSSSTR